MSMIFERRKRQEVVSFNEPLAGANGISTPAQANQLNDQLTPPERSI